MNHWMRKMGNENRCYRRGALWKTRTKLKALPSGPSFSKGLKMEITIPHNEMILLLFYEMNTGYEENIIFLWKEQIYFAAKIDSGLVFDLNPNGVNTVVGDA